MSPAELPRGSAELITKSVGSLLGAAFYLVGRARSGHRHALHPTGQVLPGVLHRHGSETATGVRWLDEAGTDHVTVRLSRATGLPKPLPDVLGLALRIPHDGGGHGDLLLATTGMGKATRYLLRPARQVVTGYTSLFPFRTAEGPLLLAAMPVAKAGTTFQLAWARPTGPWQEFGMLSLDDPTPASDTPLSFKPVEHPVPGLPHYRWAANVRRYPYAAARRARGDLRDDPDDRAFQR